MSKVIMGEGSYGEIGIVGNIGIVHVGKYTSIASAVKVIMVGHDIRKVSTYPFNSRTFRREWKGAEKIPGHPVAYGDVEIGNDCWIGYGVTILGGVRIGDGSVVAAESVVTKDVSPYSVVAGAPALLVKYRFTLKQVGQLLSIKWWDWDHKKIEENLPFLCGHNINEFIRRHYEKTS